jgi:hypothetical protein
VHILEALACADFILDSITQADRIGPPSCCQERGAEIGSKGERKRGRRLAEGEGDEQGGKERETKGKEREGKERKGKERKGVQQEREEAGRHE